MSQIEILQKELKKAKANLHIARNLIRELKQSKEDMKTFYQAQIKNLQDKTKELMTEMANLKNSKEQENAAN